MRSVEGINCDSSKAIFANLAISSELILWSRISDIDDVVVNSLLQNFSFVQG